MEIKCLYIVLNLDNIICDFIVLKNDIIFDVFFFFIINVM